MASFSTVCWRASFTCIKANTLEPRHTIISSAQTGMVLPLPRHSLPECEFAFARRHHFKFRRWKISMAALVAAAE